MSDLIFGATIITGLLDQGLSAKQELEIIVLKHNPSCSIFFLPHKQWDEIASELKVSDPNVFCMPKSTQFIFNGRLFIRADKGPRGFKEVKVL